MLKFHCHRTYLHDFDRREHLPGRVRDLTLDEAGEMLAASSFVKREDHNDTRADPMLNKGFCVVERVGDGRCHIVYNHDGKYALWDGDWAFFSAKIGL